MRRTASEVIRSLEMRVARLERKAFALKRSGDLVKLIERHGIKLPVFSQDIDVRVAANISERVGFVLGSLLAEELLQKKEIKISGVYRTFMGSSTRGGNAIVCEDTNKLIGTDGTFQRAFVKGYIKSSFHKTRVNPNPEKEAMRVMPVVGGEDIKITMRLF